MAQEIKADTLNPFLGCRLVCEDLSPQPLPGDVKMKQIRRGGTITLKLWPIWLLFNEVVMKLKQPIVDGKNTIPLTPIPQI